MSDGGLDVNTTGDGAKLFRSWIADSDGSTTSSQQITQVQDASELVRAVRSPMLHSCRVASSILHMCTIRSEQRCTTDASSDSNLRKLL